MTTYLPAPYAVQRATERLLLALCTALIGGKIWDTASFILWQPGSATRSLAAMTGYPLHVAVAMLCALALLAPFGAAQLVQRCRFERPFAKLAMLGLFIASFLWVAQVFAGRNTDLAVLRMAYVRNCLEALMYMLLMGVALNAQLRRQHPYEAAHSEEYRASNRVPLDH